MESLRFKYISMLKTRVASFVVIKNVKAKNCCGNRKMSLTTMCFYIYRQLTVNGTVSFYLLTYILTYSPYKYFEPKIINFVDRINDSPACCC